jgi:eukaryotic-like serine/threonine-protein kinase
MDGAGRTLAGRYELAEVIGRGGMGRVYRATDRVLGRSVAVKILPGVLADQDPTSVARFEREARAAAALSHPAVVAVYDTGADEAARFIVMELIAGRSLEAILRDQGALDPDRAVRIATRVADALAAAHAAGIVHRDVKPGNVMVAADGSVKVLDFGIARAIDSTTLTQTSSVVGTAAYMSPEQALGKPADERSDIYALGCVLYALLTGHPPFAGEGAAAILNQHANVAPRSLRAENNRVPPALDALVMQMLAKSPDERPQSAEQVRDQLTSSARGRSAPPEITAPTARLDATTATRVLPPAVRRDRRRLILAGGMAAVVLLIAVAALASGGGSPHATTNASRGSHAAKAATHKRAAHKTRRTTTVSASTDRGAVTSTVSGAAGALTAVATQDVQSGTIDQQAAQQITTGLSNVLNPFEMGNTMNAEQQLTNLSQQVAMLEQHGDISSVAAPGINDAVANLRMALANAPAPKTQTPGAQPPGHPAPPAAHPAPPPGHGGPPPGQANHPGPHRH